MLALMRAAEIAEQDCSIARPAALLGDRWTLVLLRQAFNGIKRFEDFQETCPVKGRLVIYSKWLMFWSEGPPKRSNGWGRAT